MRKSVSIDTLDRAFSKKIRERDCPDGWCYCVTCEKPKGYSEVDCGHYLGRQYFATRWDEMNCAAQCITCNRFNEGLKAKFRAALVKVHGEEAIARMEGMHKLGRKPRGFETLQILARIRS